MKICILGAGKMGSFFSDALCLQHEVAVYDCDLHRMQFKFNTHRLTSMEEIRDFNPDMLLNAVTLKYTLETFDKVMPYISSSCILADIASVKTGFLEYYKKCGHPFVSSHPMFGPTFANLRELSRNHAIIISESDERGKEFFREFYKSLNLNLHEYTFQGHDETIAYSLSIPFVSTMAFAACMKHQDAPGTTFQKHYEVAQGVLSEDDFLISEILFNPYTPEQIEKILEKMSQLLIITKQRDAGAMSKYLTELRENIK